jgi:hypothetical protein
MVADLSAEGAMLGGRDLPSAGEDIVMIVGPVERMARVAWRRGDKCGVQLDEPLDAACIAQMKRDADWAQMTGWAR